jgi:predicted transcriptional regulator/very-short-patch-repair endonuclease/predicted transcriptional regulator with HTH domain
MGKRIQNKSYESISLEQQEYLLNNYSGKTLIDLESETGINKRLIGFLFNDKGINIKIKPISPEQHNFIIENCNNMTVNALAEKLGIDGKRLKGYVLREGIEVKGNKVTLTDEQKDFYLNNFDIISILEMAEKTNVNRRYIGNFLRESGCNTERIMTDEQKNYILNNYPNKSIKDISSILNIDNRRVSSFIKENNIEVSYNPTFNEEDVKNIIESYKILTLDEIRKKYKSSRSRISKIIKENNINVINKTIVILDIETLTVFDNILRNQWLNTNQLADLINISIPTINKKLSEHGKYGILPKETLIEKLISYSDTFKLIYDNYVHNKEDINCGKDYIEELKTINNLNLNVSTIKSCIEIIDENFDYYHDKELIQKINNMYYDKNLSTIKIGKEFGKSSGWSRDLIRKNGGECNKHIIEIDYNTLAVYYNLLNKELLNISQLSDLINMSIPTINKKLSGHEKYNDLSKELIIEKLINHSNIFKLIYNDYIENKENINHGKDYVEELKLTNNIKLNNSTIKCCIKIIDSNFKYYYNKDLTKKIFNMYYDKNLSTIKIGKEFGKSSCWSRNLIIKNGGELNNSYSCAISGPEMEIRDFLSSYINDLEYNNKKILNGQEIDILSEKHKIAIEYNGLYYHSIESGKDKNYHLNKTTLANEKGYKLIHIFEDEYLKNKDLVLNKLLHLFNIQNKENIHARKCIIKEIKTTNETNNFLNKNHIQGSSKSTIKYGAYYNNILVSVMLFDNNTMFYKNSDNKNKYELSRFCVDNSYNINGIANRLLKQFIKDYNPIEIISFADRRWTLNKDNNLYINLNFKLDNIGNPNYFWCKKQNRYKSYNFIKTKISKKEEFKDIYSPEKTEIQMMNEAGYVRVYDCGLFRYKLSL